MTRRHRAMVVVGATGILGVAASALWLWVSGTLYGGVPKVVARSDEFKGDSGERPGTAEMRRQNESVVYADRAANSVFGHDGRGLGAAAVIWRAASRRPWRLACQSCSRPISP